MKLLKSFGISFKIVATTTLLAAIFLGAALWYVLYEVRDTLIDVSVKTLEVEVNAEKNDIELLFNEVQSTVIALKGTPPFQGIIRARKDINKVDQLSNSTLKQWKDRLQTIFKAEVESSGLYDQLRYIDASGQELVRVDYVGGQALIVPDEDLQDKSGRDYVQATTQLENNEIFVSKAELNREGNPPEISLPHRPVMRYSTPVYDNATGEIEGMIVANILVDVLVAKTSLLKNVTANLYIIDEDGFFIHHPEIHKEWGASTNLDTGFLLQGDFPFLDEKSLIQDSRSILMEDAILSYAKARPNRQDNDRTWLVLEVTHGSLIYGPVETLIKNTFWIGFLTFLLLFIVFFSVIRYLLLPLRDLVEGSRLLGEGKFDTRIKVHSHDEIGRVATSFNHMASRLSGLYSSLETKVSNRTKELSVSKENLQNQQKAVLNILEDIEEEKEKVETILSSIGDGVFVVNSARQIVLFNRMSISLSGFTESEVIGRSYKEVLKFVDEDDSDSQDNFIEEVFRTGEIREMSSKTVLVKKDGTELSVSDSAAPLTDHSGNITGVVVVFRDVSNERQVDKAKTEFVSLAAHQLRTPLSTINWYSEMLLSGDAGKLNDEQQQYLKEVYVGTQRMVSLVNSLLDVSRLELGTFVMESQETNVVVLTESVIQEQKASIEKRLQSLNIDLDKKIPLIKIDPKLLRMVLQNLLSNASKYTPKEGSIKMTVKVKNQRLFIEVKDSGIGIPKDQQNKIFTKLFRADNAKESDTDGTGLGLYILKSIVDQVEGKITFTSVEGSGTTFVVEIPIR